MDKILVLDFGGQYSHLISRRIKDLGVYSKILPSNISGENLKRIDNLKGIILSGGPASVFDKSPPKCDEGIFDLGIPILGICYGHQLISHFRGGEVIPGKLGEYGITELQILKNSILLEGLDDKERVWMNHKDIVEKLPKGYSIIAKSENYPIAAFENNNQKIYGIQFHPEVTHTVNGRKILENFAFKICKSRKQLDFSNIIKDIINETKKKIENRKTIIGLSGGVDSSTSAILVSKAIGQDLTAVYVDTGLMRHKETEFVKQIFSNYNLNLKIVDAKERFFEALKNVKDPEKKRKIIGKLFIETFEELARKEEAEILVQGTIYSDRIESGVTKNSSKIKSHHNVGGLPEKMELEIYEPLKEFYKDEVRNIAKKLGLSEDITERQVFPGPGLAIRIIGEVTPEKVDIVRKASHIVEQELKKAGIYHQFWMSFAVLLSIRSVGIQGDERSYKYPIVVRIVESEDAMTANFAKVPYDILEKISTRITNEISEVNRVVYDISNKPPATMEWE